MTTPLPLPVRITRVDNGFCVDFGFETFAYLSLSDVLADLACYFEAGLFGRLPKNYRREPISPPSGPHPTEAYRPYRDSTSGAQEEASERTDRC